jgi:hypothetical protein
MHKEYDISLVMLSILYLDFEIITWRLIPCTNSMTSLYSPLDPNQKEIRLVRLQPSPAIWFPWFNWDTFSFVLSPIQAFRAQILPRL